ncbi:hypothetical protein Hanom_Chr17g01544121 [Helianthus anomalus]
MWILDFSLYIKICIKVSKIIKTFELNYSVLNRAQRFQELNVYAKESNIKTKKKCLKLELDFFSLEQTTETLYYKPKRHTTPLPARS